MTQRDGDNPQEPIPRWVTGPEGFVRKANRQLDAIEGQLQHSPRRPQQVPEHPRGRAKLFFPALITGNSSAGTNRWAYTFAEAEYAADGTLRTKTGGRTGTAYNRAETGHTASLVWGIDTGLTDYPGGHAPRPVGAAGDSDTHDYNVGVLMEEARDVNGDKIYFFQLLWVHDGACDA